MIGTLTFKRMNLAKAYCDSLQGFGIANATSGLFLAGPRRVGKSTFLVEDLIPEAEAREWLTIYVDLWGNKLMDPALLIIEAVKEKIAAYSNKLNQYVQLKKINLLGGGIELDFTKPGLPENVTLFHVLNYLIQQTQKPILLVIDEAQHALTTPAGVNAMFALKSARDQINLPRVSPMLMLVFTGSNRDKLAQLVLKKDQPFFGSEVTPFPLLNKDFTDSLTDKINQALASDNHFTYESMWKAFQMVGHRPEILRQIVSQVAIDHHAGNFSHLLEQDVSLWYERIGEEFNADFEALSSLQKAVLAQIVTKGRAWSPFSEASMQYYQLMTQQLTTTSAVQAAIQSLREQGFIWQTSRGIYALEDAGFAEWFKHKFELGE